MPNPMEHGNLGSWTSWRITVKLQNFVTDHGALFSLVINTFGISLPVTCKPQPETPLM